MTRNQMMAQMLQNSALQQSLNELHVQQTAGQGIYLDSLLSQQPYYTAAHLGASSVSTASLLQNAYVPPGSTLASLRLEAWVRRMEHREKELGVTDMTYAEWEEWSVELDALKAEAAT